MANEATNPAATPSDNGQGGNAPPAAPGNPSGGPAPASPTPSTPAVPAGMRLVKDEDWQVRDRALSAQRGQSKFFETAKALGFTKPDDFAKVEKLAGAIKAKGLDWDKAADMLIGQAGGGSQSQGDGDDDDPVDVEAIAARAAERAMTTIEAKRTEAAIRSSHETAQTREGQLLESTVEELAGKGASDADKQLVRDLVEVTVTRARSKSLYEDGHLLANEAYKPLGDAEFTAIKAALGDRLKQLRGRQLERVADAALGSSGGTLPGRGQGAPTQPKDADRLPGRGGLQERNAKLEQLADWADKQFAGAN